MKTPDELAQVEPQKLYDWLCALSEALFHEVADAPGTPRPRTRERRLLWHSLDDVILFVRNRWPDEIETRTRSRLG